jgi:hypothetical protein
LTKRDFHQGDEGADREKTKEDEKDSKENEGRKATKW